MHVFGAALWHIEAENGLNGTFKMADSDNQRAFMAFVWYIDRILTLSTTKWGYGDSVRTFIFLCQHKRWGEMEEDWNKNALWEQKNALFFWMGRKVASPQFFWQQHLWLSRLIKVLKDCWGHANKPALRLWNRNKGLQTSTNDGQGRDYAVTVGLHGRTANQHKHGTSLSLFSLSLLLAFNSLPLSSSSSQQPTFVSDTVVSEEPAVLCSSSSALEVSVPLFWLCVCVCVFTASGLFVRGQRSASATERWVAVIFTMLLLHVLLLETAGETVSLPMCKKEVKTFKENLYDKMIWNLWQNGGGFGKSLALGSPSGFRAPGC